MMKSSILALSAVAAIALSAPIGCSSTTDNCDNISTCVPPHGGSSGSGGDAGMGDAGASSGASGMGHGGAGGSGTAGASGGQSNAGSSGVSGDSGAGGEVIPPCDTTKTPATEACLIGDNYAVFVAPGGKDTAAGTKAAPLGTLSAAVSLAGSAKLVLVCDATYDEHVNIMNGTQIYGGFRCSDWASENGSPLFKPTSAGPALKIDTVTAPVAINGVSFEVPDAMAPGETALAAIVNSSPMVTFEAVSLKAGKGKPGAIGTLSIFSYNDVTTLNGNSETTAGSGGASKTCMCQPSLSSTGGLGGAPVAGGQNGSDGLPDHGGGQAGDHTKGCSSGGGGIDGSDASGAAAASGALSSGTASAAGWNPTAGSDGATGSPGQGGGGGASRNNLGHGGGGGCGGCGGNGAKGGNGGGGSVALLLVNSPAAIQTSTLTTADAGAGGNGVAGQPGQQDVGVGGGTISALNSCPGGVGGKGGAGGPSGGGAGGISVGVVWKGTTPPTLTNTMTMTGTAGAKGLGGVPGTNDGVTGVRQDVLQVQ